MLMESWNFDEGQKMLQMTTPNLYKEIWKRSYFEAQIRVESCVP
jgi:hypothetical protein